MVLEGGRGGGSGRGSGGRRGGRRCRRVRRDDDRFDDWFCPLGRQGQCRDDAADDKCYRFDDFSAINIVDHLTPQIEKTIPKAVYLYMFLARLASMQPALIRGSNRYFGRNRQVRTGTASKLQPLPVVLRLGRGHLVFGPVEILQPSQRQIGGDHLPVRAHVVAAASPGEDVAALRFRAGGAAIGAEVLRPRCPAVNVGRSPFEFGGGQQPGVQRLHIHRVVNIGQVGIDGCRFQIVGAKHPGSLEHIDAARKLDVSLRDPARRRLPRDIVSDMFEAILQMPWQV